jgi:type I restriction enzyme M protein
MSPVSFQHLANFIWSVADLLRGPYRPPQYERVMLPLTVLRRFDAVLAPTKETVVKRYEELRAKNILNIDAVLNNLAKDDVGQPLGFHNHSQLDFHKLKGDPDHDDPFPGTRFDYLLANPPFGVDWKAEKKTIDRWPNFRGYSGKLPRINDGALLFLIYMMSKFQDHVPGSRDKPGSRTAIVFNGSPLFAGGAGSGESEIRRWIIARDQLEAIIALPEQMFYNTGIGTFIWIVTNRKAAHRKGKIQLIDARERWTPMRRSLGDKRRYLYPSAIDALTREHGQFASEVRQWVRLDKDDKPLEFSQEQPSQPALNGQQWAERVTSRTFDNADFGYRRITVLRPLRLRFQIEPETRARFLRLCPELTGAIAAIETALGTEPLHDWNLAWDRAQQVVKTLPADIAGWTTGAKGTAQKKIFRDCFATVDPEAAPVIAKHHKIAPLDRAAVFPAQTLPDTLTSAELHALLGLYADGKGKHLEYEPDPALKDAENIPLKEDIAGYFLREVRPYVAEAWIDRETLDEQDGGIGKVGYEVNFNRVFFQYHEPRPLKEIDAELADVELRIMDLLREVTE